MQVLNLDTKAKINIHTFLKLIFHIKTKNTRIELVFFCLMIFAMYKLDKIQGLQILW